MKTLKYRAWDKELKEMIVWGELIGLQRDSFEAGLEPNETNIILMQFTGLLDKNGKEIYEGDILSCKTKNFEHRDTIELGWATGKATNDGYGFIWSITKDLVLVQDLIDERYKVIGNIYENPELLPPLSV